MACAQQLARAGHDVTLFEKNDRIGGLLRYGIPDFKMEKHLIDRRIEQMARRRRDVPHQRRTSACTTAAQELLEDVRRGRAHRRLREAARPRRCPGRELDGVHFAMDFLPQQNKKVAGDDVAEARSSPPASTWS